MPCSALLLTGSGKLVEYLDKYKVKKGLAAFLSCFALIAMGSRVISP